MTIKQQGGVFGRNPTFNNLTADGSVSLNGPVVINESAQDADFRVETVADPNGLFVDASTSRIGMGTGTPTSDLHMYDANNVIHTVEVASGGTGVSSIRLKHATRHYGMYVGTTNNLIFYDYGAPAERMRITSAGDLSLTSGNLVVTNGKGVDFSATSGTGTSELFNDYEEGTWTPTVTAASGAFTTVSASGFYTKIGRIVSFSMSIVITDAGTAAGNMTATLPFAATSINAIAYGREIAATGSGCQGTIISGSSNCIIQRYDTVSIIGTGRTVVMTGTYIS